MHMFIMKYFLRKELMSSYSRSICYLSTSSRLSAGYPNFEWNFWTDVYEPVLYYTKFNTFLAIKVNLSL